MQIGGLSARTGVHIETIRYYEHVGLIPKPARLPSGRRVYAEADVRRLGIIRHARELGFEMEAVRRLLALQDQPEASCEGVTALVEAQLAEVERRMTQLEGLKKEFQRMLESCHRGQMADCRILDALAAAEPDGAGHH